MKYAVYDAIETQIQCTKYYSRYLIAVSAMSTCADIISRRTQFTGSYLAGKCIETFQSCNELRSEMFERKSIVFRWVGANN